MAEALEREGFYERFCFELLFHRRSYGRALCGTRYPLYLFSLFPKWETVRRRLGQVHAVRSVLPSDGRRSRDADVPGKRRGIYCLFHAVFGTGKRYSACHAFLGYLGRIQFRLCGAGRTSAKIPGSENLYCRFSGRFVRLRPADGPSGRLKR